MLPFSTREVYESWSSWKADKAIKEIWVVVPACIFWCIWTKEMEDALMKFQLQAIS